MTRVVDHLIIEINILLVQLTVSRNLLENEKYQDTLGRIIPQLKNDLLSLFSPENFRNIYISGNLIC